MSYLEHLRGLLRSELEVWIGRALPRLIHRSLTGDLHGVWGRGDWSMVPGTGALLIANHHSWWDVYLAWLIAERLERRASGMMSAEQLDRFPFFRRIGVISDREPREALRRLERGDLFFLFPEGNLRQAGAVASLEPGVAWLARMAEVPVVPVALRVLLRGAQHPEAFVAAREVLAPSETLLIDVKRVLNEMLFSLDQLLARSDPEAPPPGFEVWMGGKGSANQRATRAAGLWRR